MSSAVAPAPDTRAATTLWVRVQRLLPLGLSLLITLTAAPIAIFITQETGELRRYGALAYPILFVLQTLFSATLFLPAPGMAIVAAAGTVLDPLWVGIIAGLGSATGELSGYVLGYYGRRAVPTDNSRVWRLAERAFRNWGFLSLILLAAIPNPVFDAMGILAGGLRYPLGRFWLATAAGKILKFLCTAYGGWFVSTWFRVAG
ncbi:MAG: VTT domain-containing protein [Chloroflexi bacterium]|nr:VTT domain-containing protein [Chloroflexota bacterium]